MLGVVTPIQGNFSTQILASKMSSGFAKTTPLNYVLFSRRKKIQDWAVHSASLADIFCTGYTATVLQTFTHHSQFFFSYKSTGAAQTHHKKPKH